MSPASAGAESLSASSALEDVLRAGAYRRLWLSGLFLNVARWMDVVALGWLALELTGSPFMVGLAAFGRSAPMMGLGAFTGVVADRMPRARVLLATQSVGGAAGLALAALFATGRGGYWPLVALSMLFGAVWALDFPARRTALFAIVGPGRVVAAVSLDTVSMQLAKMTGPVLAGFVLARLGAATCYALVAVFYGLGLVLVLGLRHEMGEPGAPRAGSVAASLGAGFRAVWLAPVVRAVLLITILMNVLHFPYQQMLPVFARDVLGTGPEGLGALVAANGLGALVGALAIASRHGFVAHRKLFAAAVLVGPALLVLLAASHWQWACLLLLLALGVAESGFASMQSTIVLLSTPEATRGGAMGILSVCIGTQPLGALWVGFLSGRVGVAAALAVNSLTALAMMLPLAVPLARGTRRPAPWGDA